MINNKALLSELARSDENYLTSLANKGLYKRAVKDAEAFPDTALSETDDGVEISVGIEKCLIKAPLDKSECSCPARGVCRHILAAALLLRGMLDENELASAEPAPAETKASEPAPSPEREEPKEKRLNDKDIKKVHETAAICKAQMSALLKHGLVRAAESADDGFEIAAVRCHAAKMAAAEKSIRELGTRLRDFLDRRAAFDEKLYMQRLCRTASLIKKLENDNITEADLGSFKKTYTDYNGTLHILPIGTRSVTEGDYTGTIYYFLDLDESRPQRFLTYSDLRPVFYENSKRFRRGSAEVWGAGVSIKSLMRDTLTLINAKVSGGSLSSSSQTTIVAQSRANLNCAAFRKEVYNDLSEIAIKLSKKNAKEEARRLFLFHPKELLCFEFDKTAQQFAAELSDGKNAVRMTAKYTAYTKRLIEQLEAHARAMTDHPDLYFVWLVSAYFDEGELVLSPIEMYDFITPIEERRFTLPEEYENIARQAGYCASLSTLFDETENKLTQLVRSGFSAALTDTDKLLKLSADYGLEYFHQSLEELFRSAEGYRHSIKDKSTEVLEKMAAVYEYIALARSRLALISALYNMRM